MSAILVLSALLILSDKLHDLGLAVLPTLGVVGVAFTYLFHILEEAAEAYWKFRRKWALLKNQFQSISPSPKPHGEPTANDRLHLKDT